MRNIPVAGPVTTNDEQKKPLKVFKSGMLTQGKMVGEFEKKSLEYIGNSIKVSNVIVALDVTLKALDIKERDEVITTPFTFMAIKNAVLY